VAAVRDGFSAVDATSGRVVGFLSHSLVLPPWRRSGVASLLRAAPVAFARRHAASDAEITLVAEMEPIAPGREDTLIRHLAYGRAGFRVLDPTALPYAQPDFRELAGAPWRPIPFLLLVRCVGREEDTEIAQDRAVAILDHLAAIHAPAVGDAQLAAIRAHATSRLPTGPIRLLTPPGVAEDADRIRPLTSVEVLPLFPPEWLPTDP
jgi:GNAT superfamily N-acetyltransferase